MRKLLFFKEGELKIIFLLILSILFTSCVDNTITVDDDIWISNVLPNPANINDTLTVVIDALGTGKSVGPIDSLSQVSVILSAGNIFQKQNVTCYRIGNRILGDFRYYNFLDTLRGTQFIQFSVTDSTMSNSKVNVGLKDYLIKSDIVLTINK